MSDDNTQAVEIIHLLRRFLGDESEQLKEPNQTRLIEGVDLVEALKAENTKLKIAEAYQRGAVDTYERLIKGGFTHLSH